MENYAFEQFMQIYDAMSEDIKQHCVRTGHYMSELLVALGKEELNHLWKLGSYSPLYCHTLGNEMTLEAELNDAIIFHRIFEQQMTLHNAELCLFSSLTYDVMTGKYEWWDGTGLPTGVSKERIPFIGRLCAVADRYDILRTLGGNHEVAAEEIRKESGTHFDPEIVEAINQLKMVAV